MKITLLKIVLLIIVSLIPVLTVLAQTDKKLSALIIDKYSIIKKIPENAKEIIICLRFINKDISDYSGILKIEIKDLKEKIFFQDEKQVVLKTGQNNNFEYEVSFVDPGRYSIKYSFYDVDKKMSIDRKFEWETEPVNFFYTFSTPHRITIALPDNSNKTLLDLENGKLNMSWTDDNLIYEPFASFKPPKTDWRLNIQPLLNGQPFEVSRWERSEGYLPVLLNTYDNKDASVILEALGADSAAIIKIEVKNKSNKIQKVGLNCVCRGKGYNPGWIDSNILSDHLLAGWGAPADKIVVFGLGSQEYLPTASTSLNMNWELKPYESRTGWLIRPYNKFSSDLNLLKAINWQQKYDQSKNIWRNLRNRASEIIIPDKNIVNAFYACLSDIFIMREPIGKGYLATIPGTEVYRSAPNSIEPAIVTVALDQLGLHTEAEEGYRVNWDLQTSEGDWSEPRGWSHLMWGTSGFKAWALMEHYYITLDRNFLLRHYSKLLACSRWQDRQRQKTKININGEKSIYYGLMPKGMGDCGLLDGKDFYGIFYAHNIWAVYADFLAYQAAIVLDKKEDIKELKEIYETAKEDLLIVMERGAIKDKDGFRWLSGVPGKETGSCWGILNAAFPANILSPDHELITGTLKHVEKIMSAGGIPIHTGWMSEGMWVAITLDNFAEVHLARNEGKIANAFLYSTLNHGTPLFTWCEERGQDPFTTEISGDRQHLWTPVAVVRFIRDMLIMEEGNTLHLSRGIADGWVKSGNPIGIKNASSRFGIISYNIIFDEKKSKLIGELSFPKKGNDFETILHIPLSNKIKIIESTSGSILPDGSGIKFTVCKGYISFTASLK